MALVDSIIGAESGGNPLATNPRSSAMGAGQFIASTWLDMIRRYRPDLAQGKSDGDLLALRANPILSRQMTDAYAQENGTKLSAAGFEANPGNTYLAHFAGPGGAVKVLQADPGTPVGQVLGDAAMKANPFLANMTAGDLRAWANRKMGAPTPPAAIPNVGANAGDGAAIPAGAYASANATQGSPAKPLLEQPLPASSANSPLGMMLDSVAAMAPLAKQQPQLLGVNPNDLASQAWWARQNSMTG